jgi:iron complex outermembrane recepter protein
MLKRTVLAKSLLLAFSGSAVVWSATALAQTAAPADQPAQLQRVEVTGSSIKRIDAESALPVQVITREQIQKTGAANVEQLLQTISSMSSSGGLTAASASGATTGGISAVSIHGLSSIRTLVLINGRRVSPYGLGFSNDSVSVDVNSIPLAAIERVEVLKDGASAIYGSDAIAGVVNFILRKDFKGVELTGEYGDTTQGGGALMRGSATVGFGDLEKDNYNIMLVASLQREKVLFGGQREFAKSAISVDHLNDTTSGNTFPANIAAADGSFGTRNPSRPTGCLAPYSTVDPLLSTNTACRFDPAPLVTLVPRSDRVSLFGSGRLMINNNLELFAEASYNRNKIRTVIQPVPLSDQFALPDNNPLFSDPAYNGLATITLKPSSAFYPTAYVTGITGGATPDLLVRYRAATAGNRDLTDTSTAPRLVLGARGTVFGADLEGAFLHTSSEVRERVNGGYPIYSQFLPILNSGTVNFFGPNSAAIDAQLLAATFQGDAFKVKSTIDSFALKGSKDLVQLPAGALAVAAGGEFRKEKYDFQASTELQQGDVSGYGGNFLPVNRERKVAAAFGEVNVPIVKGLEADFAVRWDKYQGVGSSTTPKLSLRWQPNSMFLIRGSVGEGFRAPSLADLYAGNTQSVTPTGLSDPLRCFNNPNFVNDDIKDCQTQFSTTFGGNAQLKPEKSKSATLGIVLQPTNDVSVGLDYFKVRLKDTIIQGIDAPTILSDPAKYAALIQRGAPDGKINPDTGQPLPGSITGLLQTNLNLGATKVSGWELDFKWAIPAGDMGKFSVGLNGTYFLQYDTQNLDGTYTGNVDLVNGSTGGVIPRWKHYLSIDWTRGPWSATFAQNFQKGYHDTGGNLADPVDNPGESVHDARNYVTYDTQVTYSGIKNWKLTLGARNVFDHDPPYVNTNAAFQSGYDPQYADPRGRFIYARVTYAF